MSINSKTAAQSERDGAKSAKKQQKNSLGRLFTSNVFFSALFAFVHARAPSIHARRPQEEFYADTTRTKASTKHLAKAFK